jgi:hypothetical protein
MTYPDRIKYGTSTGYYTLDSCHTTLIAMFISVSSELFSEKLPILQFFPK